MKNNNKDAETLEEVLHAIHSVIDNADETKMRFVEYGLLEEVMGIIFSFDGNELLVELGLQILRTLFDLSNHLLDRVVINESSSTSPSEILPYSWRDIESNVQTSPHLIRFKHIFKKLFVQSSASSSSNKLLSKVIGKYIQNASIVENGCAILTSSLLILSWSEEQVSSNDTNDTNHVIGIIRTKKIQSTSISPLPSFPSLYLDMLKYHFQNLEICKLCLLGLLQLFNFENLANPLLSVDCCQLVLQTLDTHYGQDLKLLMLSYNVIIQLSVDAKCRKIMSQSHISNVNIILTTLAHYVHHLDAARLGCMTISAVCISPVDDALHTFRRIKYSRLLQSRQTSNEITQSDETSTPESSNQQNTENAKASTTTSSTDAYNLTAWLPSKLLNFQNNADGFSSELAQVNFFHLDTLCILDQSSSANKMIIDAAATIISSGLSDQEEKSILNSREKAEEKRGNGDSLVTHGGLLILLTLLQIHKGNHQVLVHTMNAINSIFLTSLVRSTLFIDKLTEELIEAIQHFQTSRVDELVLALTLFTLGSWCVPSRIKNSNDSKTFVDTYPQRNKLLELGFVDILGSILETYLSDALLVEISCRNLHFLTDGNEQIKLQISQNMVSETLVRNITSCFESHSMNSTAIHYICLAISGLAFDNKILQGLFQDRQIYQLIESCLKRKLLDVDVCQSCCRAIYALKDLNPLWYECSVAELVVSGLNQHIQDVDAVEWIFKAIGSLAEFPPNKEIMDSNGVCKSIATAMHRHVSSETIFTAFSRDTSSAGVAQWGCAAIYYLAKGVNGRDFQEKLVTAGVCDSVARALVKYSELEYVAFSCCRALVVLLINNEPLKTKFGAAGVCSCIVESLHLFPSSTNVSTLVIICWFINSSHVFFPSLIM